MRHLAIGLLVAGLLVPGAGRAATERTHAGATHEPTKHSGRIVTTGPRATTIELEELGAQGRPLKRVIELQPDTKIALVARSTDAAPGQWPGDFRETPLAATELKPGEFATVTTARRDGRLSAVEITVVSPTPKPSATTSEPRRVSAAPSK
jgi:hypothetical protein